MRNNSGYTTILLALILWSASSIAQELTPRTYWPAPVGTKVLVTGYSYSEGDVSYSWGKAEGLVVDRPASRNFSGFGDVGVTVTVNLIGAALPELPVQPCLAL